MREGFKELLEWSSTEYSILPWRRDRSLYTTLVSEVMLQQTTVGTVLGRYDDFLKSFPDLEALAQATEEEMRSAWQGLGYYRRAANLLKAARAFKENGFPEEEAELQNVPGIGPYTASAIVAIGHDKPALAVDGNLKRVLSRYFKISTPYEKGLDNDIRQLCQDKDFASLLKDLGPRKVNEALMDLGRVVCRVKNPLCLTCPLSSKCRAYQSASQEELPVRLKKAVKPILLKLIRFICIKENKLLLYKKEPGEWLEGQWELPTAILSCTDASLQQYPRYESLKPESSALKTQITKYKIENFPVPSCKKEILANIPFYKNRHIDFFDLSQLPLISTASEKILRREGII